MYDDLHITEFFYLIFTIFGVSILFTVFNLLITDLNLFFFLSFMLLCCFIGFLQDVSRMNVDSLAIFFLNCSYFFINLHLIFYLINCMMLWIFHKLSRSVSWVHYLFFGYNFLFRSANRWRTVSRTCWLNITYSAGISNCYDCYFEIWKEIRNTISYGLWFRS